MYSPLTPEQLHDLPNLISAPRFTTYLQACGNDTERALALYRWNFETSAAFMGPLHLCEIAIRNGIAEAIETTHGGGWPWTEGFIRSLPSPPKGYNSQLDLKRLGSKHTTPGKIIAELQFIYWEKLLTNRFETQLWKRQFFVSFPGAPRDRGHHIARENCRADVKKVRLFRNRIAHHEPIFNRNLQDDRDRIIRIIKWRNPVAASWLESFEPVSSLINRKP